MVSVTTGTKFAEASAKLTTHAYLRTKRRWRGCVLRELVMYQNKEGNVKAEVDIVVKRSMRIQTRGKRPKLFID